MKRRRRRRNNIYRVGELFLSIYFATYARLALALCDKR